MLPFVIGLLLALSFGLVTGSVYGVGALVQDPWVLLVLLGLVTASGMMTLANRAPRGGRPHRHPALVAPAPNMPKH